VHNNTFYYDLGTPVVIPEGNYNPITIIQALNTALDAASGLTWSCSYNTTTGKITYETTAPFTLTSNEYNYQWMGLQRSTTVNSQGNSLASPNVNNLIGTRYIDIVGQLNANSSSMVDLDNHNILARVPVNVSGSFTTIFFNRSYLSPAELEFIHLSKLSIKLVDEFGLQINLNGGSLAGTILIEY
jgi:hypothetical protein